MGEFAIGTNIGVHDVIGNILQDEKIPGVHIAFGNPYGAHTGAEWYSLDAHRRGRAANSISGPTAGRSCAAARFVLRDSRPAGALQRGIHAGKVRGASSIECESAVRRGLAFRHSETPCFFPARADRHAWRATARELMRAVDRQSGVPARSAPPFPQRYRVPNEATVPLFVQVDFGLAMPTLEPQLG